MPNQSSPPPSSAPLASSLAQGEAVIRSVVRTLPDAPGVYRMINARNDVLYVGKAKNLKKRVVSYTQIAQLPHRLKRMVSETVRMEIVTTHTETEALLLESNLIKKLKPAYNILLKDDKSFPYILISATHPFPRILKHRGQQTVQGTYFGPFASGTAAEECFLMVQKIFLLRNCTDNFFATRHRPCLQFHIKRCSAPCVGKIDPMAYADLVQQAKDFLGGKSEIVQKILADKMNEASDKQQYEEAGIYRDRLRLIAHVQGQQRIHIPEVKNADIIAIAEKGPQTCVQVFFFRQGQNFGTESFFLAHGEDATIQEKLAAFVTQFYDERPPSAHILLSHSLEESDLIATALFEKYQHRIRFETPRRGPKYQLMNHALENAEEALTRRFVETATFHRLLDEVGQVFDLSARPQRIEIYDNSHLQGTNPYGVMVVADENGFHKKAYRKFSIKESGPDQGGDDYSMMREVLRRRFAHKDETTWQLPDLMLIDGGAGHLRAVTEVAAELGIQGVTIVGIAKGVDRDAGRERFFMTGRPVFTLPPKSPVMHFLQRLRDQAHRFAIGTHRAGRQKSMVKSRLDDIPHIGPKRKKCLLQHFGSVTAIKTASLQDLQNVPGINKSVATVVYQYFHGS